MNKSSSPADRGVLPQGWRLQLARGPAAVGVVDEIGMGLLLPGQPRMGEPLPEDLCDDPVPRFATNGWQTAERPAVDVPIPADVLADYAVAQDEYQRSLDSEPE